MSQVVGRRSEIVEVDGDMLRRLRTSPRNRLSQEALARRVGVSAALVGHLETGYTRRVSRQIVESMAAELQTSPHALLRGSGEDGRIQSSLDRISSMLERLLHGEGPAKAARLHSDAGAVGSEVELVSWATAFMRENSRRVPLDRPIPSAEQVASLPTYETVDIGFDLTEFPGTLHTHSNAELLHGRAGVARALIDALRQGTAEPPTGPNRTVLLTYQGLDIFTAVDPELRVEWLQTLRGVLDSGWNLLHLLRYPSLARRYLDITSQAVELAGRKGRYVAKYLADDPDSSTDYDLLVIPGSCTMQFWSTESGMPADAALKLDDPNIQRQMAAVFRKSESMSSVLMDTYPQYTALLRVLLRPEQVAGDRFQVKPGPAFATVPKGLWRWAARQVRGPLEARTDSRTALDLADQLERAMIKRSVLLDRSLASYSSYNLMTAEALDELVGGRYDRNDWLIVHAQEMQPDGRIPVKFRVDHLERLVELLDGQDNFHLGIAHTDRMEEPFPQNLLTVRIGTPSRTTSAAFVQVWPESQDVGREEGFYAVFRESRTIAGFHQYFTELWNGTGVTRDRTEVREILRCKILQLEREAGRAMELSQTLPRRRPRARRS